MTPRDIAHRFDYHPADSDEKRDAHATVRASCRALADDLDERLPDGREKNLALTNVEQAMFWANAAVARHRG